MTTLFKSRLMAASVLALMATPALAVDVEFYFPVAVGGQAAETIQALTDKYMESHPDVNITATYTGSYADTTTKALTSARGGNPPVLAILLSTDMYAMIDEDVVEPFDDHVPADEFKTWIDGFYPAFLLNSQFEGKTWGIPFQRSTPVIYWNKDAFAAAGLDPEKGPETWAEMLEMAEKLTVKDASGTVKQWGVRFPSSGFPSWLWTGLVASNGALLADDTGTHVNFNSPEAVEALEYLVSLSAKGVMQPGILDWGATPKSFIDGESAIVWTTTGNLTNIRQNATFPFGVGMLPASKQHGAPTGGGNFYLFKDASDEEKAAAVDFVRWATLPEQAAEWSIATGYVAPRPDAWETQQMQDYVKEVPGALVAREQLEYAVAELSTFAGPQVTQALNTQLEAAVTGSKSPQEALDQAQAEAEAILKPYQ